MPRTWLAAAAAMFVASFGAASLAAASDILPGFPCREHLIGWRADQIERVLRAEAVVLAVEDRQRDEMQANPARVDIRL